MVSITNIRSKYLNKKQLIKYYKEYYPQALGILKRFSLYILQPFFELPLKSTYFRLIAELYIIPAFIDLQSLTFSPKIDRYVIFMAVTNFISTEFIQNVVRHLLIRPHYTEPPKRRINFVKDMEQLLSNTSETLDQENALEIIEDTERVIDSFFKFQSLVLMIHPITTFFSSLILYQTRTYLIRYVCQVPGIKENIKKGIYDIRRPIEPNEMTPFVLASIIDLIKGFVSVRYPLRKLRKEADIFIDLMKRRADCNEFELHKLDDEIEKKKKIIPKYILDYYIKVLSIHAIAAVFSTPLYSVNMQLRIKGTDSPYEDKEARELSWAERIVRNATHHGVFKPWNGYFYVAFNSLSVLI